MSAPDRSPAHLGVPAGGWAEPRTVEAPRGWDVPAMTAAGRPLAPGETFYGDAECFARPYALVMSSRSLQYGRWGRETLAL